MAWLQSGQKNERKRVGIKINEYICNCMKSTKQNIVIGIVTIVFVLMSLQSAARRIDGAVFATLDSISADTLYFSLNNRLNDSIGLFTTYLPSRESPYEICYAKSVYLHKYDSGKDSYTLSFAPLLPFLTMGYYDCIVQSPDAVVAGRLHFSCETIEPGGTRQIVVPVDAVLQREYVKDLDPYNLCPRESIIRDITKEVKEAERVEAEKLDCVYVEFAYYMLYDLKEFESGDYYFTDRQNRLLRNYYLVSIPVMTVFK